MDGKSSCIALQCLKALLLIGGVEPNPGPHKTQDQQIEIQREILSDLCADAPDTTVRDTLRLYDPQLDTKALVKQINLTSKQNIVACLIYLGQPAMTDYKKDTCVNTLICRIQNLFPDDCVFCKEEYCIKLTDTSLLSCKICGQGAHSPCILNHIQLQAAETLTAEDIWRKINPTDLPGLHYLCPACEKATIPYEEDGKLKKPKPSIREENDGSHDDVNGEDITQNDGDPTFDEEEATSVTQEEIQSTHTKKRNNHSKTTEDEGAMTLPHATMRSNICSFYRKGTCRYGVSGRGCPKEHPKPCRKLLQHGTKAPNGCTMGRTKCNKFHPKMCPTSIRKGERFNESCRLKHVIGTKRIPREQPDSETESPETPSNTQANIDFFRSTTPPQSRNAGGSGNKASPACIQSKPRSTKSCAPNIGSHQQHGSRSSHCKSTALDKPYSTHDAQHEVQHPVAASNATAVQPSRDSVHPCTHDVRTGEHGTCSRDGHSSCQCTWQQHPQNRPVKLLFHMGHTGTEASNGPKQSAICPGSTS